MSHPDWRNAQNRAALDVAVLEEIIKASIQKLADLLQTEGSHETSTAWLWNVAYFISSAVVTLEELRIFLSALRADGFGLSEVTFHREGAASL